MAAVRPARGFSSSSGPDTEQAPASRQTVVRLAIFIAGKTRSGACRLPSATHSGAVVSALLEPLPRSEPFADAACHRPHVRVPHALEGVRGERRAMTASAVEDDLLAGVRDGALDVPLDHALPHPAGPRDSGARPFALLAHVDEVEALSGLHPALDLGHGRLADPGAGLFDQSLKAAHPARIPVIAPS